MNRANSLVRLEKQRLSLVRLEKQRLSSSGESERVEQELQPKNSEKVEFSKTASTSSDKSDGSEARKN